jgi:hypothetical protein
LENPGDAEILYIVAPDLAGRMKAGLSVVDVGQQEIGRILVGCVKLGLRDRRNVGLARGRFGVLLGFLSDTGPGKQARYAEQYGIYPVFFHVSAPSALNRRLLHAGVL